MHTCMLLISPISRCCMNNITWSVWLVKSHYVILKFALTYNAAGAVLVSEKLTIGHSAILMLVATYIISDCKLSRSVDLQCGT